MAKITLKTLLSGFLSTVQMKWNFDAIAAEFQNKVLYRNNTSGESNVMENDLDMNSHKVLNVGAPTEPTDLVRLSDLTDLGAIDPALLPISITSADVGSFLTTTNGTSLGFSKLKSSNLFATDRAALEAVGSTAANPLVEGDVVQLAKYTTLGDGGAGRYQYYASSTDTVDGTSVINAYGGVGRWLRLDKANTAGTTTVSVLTFGADPTGAADSFSAFSDAIAFVVGKGGGNITVPAGTYLWSSGNTPFSTASDVQYALIGDGSNITTIQSSTAAGSALFLTGTSVNISGISFTSTAGVSAARLASSTSHGIQTPTTVGAHYFYDVKVIDQGGIGFYLKQPRASRLENCSSVNNASAVSMLGTNGVTWSNYINNFLIYNTRAFASVVNYINIAQYVDNTTITGVLIANTRYDSAAVGSNCIYTEGLRTRISDVSYYNSDHASGNGRAVLVHINANDCSVSGIYSSGIKDFIYVAAGGDWCTISDLRSEQPTTVTGYGVTIVAGATNVTLITDDSKLSHTNPIVRTDRYATAAADMDDRPLFVKGNYFTADSSTITFNSDNTTSVALPAGFIPDHWTAHLLCDSTDNSYGVGDEVPIPLGTGLLDAFGNYIYTVGVYFDVSVPAIVMLNRNGKLVLPEAGAPGTAGSVPANGKWKLRVRAWKHAV